MLAKFKINLKYTSQVYPLNDGTLRAIRVSLSGFHVPVPLYVRSDRVRRLYSERHDDLQSLPYLVSIVLQIVDEDRFQR